jgi:hypothetical protein
VKKSVTVTSAEPEAMQSQRSLSGADDCHLIFSRLPLRQKQESAKRTQTNPIFSVCKRRGGPPCPPAFVAHAFQRAAPAFRPVFRELPSRDLCAPRPSGKLRACPIPAGLHFGVPDSRLV